MRRRDSGEFSHKLSGFPRSHDAHCRLTPISDSRWPFAGGVLHTIRCLAGMLGTDAGSCFGKRRERMRWSFTPVRSIGTMSIYCSRFRRVCQCRVRCNNYRVGALLERLQPPDIAVERGGQQLKTIGCGNLSGAAL
jgi:hypothetical protein